MPSTRSSPASATSDGPVVADFIEAVVTVSKGRHAGEPIRLRPWQRELLNDLFALRGDGRRRFRQALVGLPRKNGKSALGSGLALFGLFDEQGAEVYSCAGDKEQARIVFAEARRSVEASPMLSERLKLYRDAIEYPATHSVYRVLSAEAYTKEGLNPSLVVFDELHVQPNDELWNVMNLGSGTREQPLTVAITTAGVRSDSSGQDSVCYRLWQYGQRVLSGEVDDPSFFFRWWAAPQDADYRDPVVWAGANPAYDDFLFAEDFHATVRRTPENEFRTKRLNQWVAAVQAWLPAGAWDACADPRPVPDDVDVVLGFDGSFNGDSTALVAVSCEDVPHVDVAACWERPADAEPGWQVPIIEVEDAIRAACRRWSVREVVCDPFRWARSMQVLEGEGLPMVEYPQTPARMTPATTRFYEAVVNGALTHSGDPRLARHVGNAVLRTDSRGARLSKDAKGSQRRIDLAVAAVMGVDRACQPTQRPRTFFGAYA
jgi:phage terminase large subunit-like protein